jgi:vitamin B12 transporter
MRPLPTAVAGAVLSLITLASRPALANDTGSVSGTLTTSDGVPLPQVVLTLTGAGAARSIVTGPEGRFSVAGVAAGEYRLAADAPGLVLTQGTLVSVRAGQQLRIHPTLAPAPLSEHVVVSATRGDALPSTLGTSATVLDRARLDEREPATVLDALRDVPGLTVARAGGIGPQASVFVRGGESRFARVLLDGVPLNEPGGAFNFGALLPLEIERIEVVRGAASSLYATDALAGVVQIVTRRAALDETRDLRGSIEGGTFETWKLTAGTSGRAGGWDWSVGALRQETDNQEPNSRFESTAGAASLGRTIGERTRLRVIVRGDTGATGTPGSTAFVRPDLDASYERSTAAATAQLHRSGERVTHTWSLGFQSAHQLSLNPEDSGAYTPRFGEREGFAGSDWTNPEGFQNDTRRLTASYQLEARVDRRQLLTAGADLERETGVIGDRRGELLSPRRTSAGAYLQDRIVVSERLFVTLGARAEHNGSYGWAAVPRASLALRLRSGANATTARASAGAGVKEPSFLESFGVSLFTRGNPELDPERSRTWDAGIEQRLAGGRLRLSGTFFHHTYLDQIAYFVESYQPYVGTYRNLGKTRARGAEISLEAAPTRALRLSADYTYLDGRILVSAPGADPIYATGRPLLRRPKHQASLSAGADAGRLSAGVTLALVGRRADSDFWGLGLTENGGYARVDARLRARLARSLELFAVGENLLDRRYVEILGYPALGRALRVGLRLRGGLRPHGERAARQP